MRPLYALYGMTITGLGAPIRELADMAKRSIIQFFVKCTNEIAILSILIGAALSSGDAFAQDAAKGGPTPSPPGAAVYFVDITDGATIAPQTTIHFGLRGMGVAPAGSTKANSGHHHLIIDSELPPLDEPIPSDENHLHFGGGQTEVELTLSLGPHTLQLLLGDANHIPHSPPVMSSLIHVTVAEAQPAQAQVAPPQEAAPGGRRPSPPGAKVYFVYPQNGAHVPLTFVAKFGLEKMGVAPAGVDKANTGHHHLLIDTELPPLDEPIPSDENHLHFGAGQTEATVTLTPGKHKLQLLLGDGNHIPHFPAVFSSEITVYASASAQPQPSAQQARPALQREGAPRRNRESPSKASLARKADRPVSREPDFGAHGHDLAPDPTGSCQRGFHSVPAPFGSGFRCVQNGF
jgi:hypothetical protein